MKVSICIPAYNNTKGLQRLFESIEQQSFTDYEVIITDDSQGEEVANLATAYPHFQYEKNAVRLGATKNWNAAMQKAKGAYIKIMHHDDWFTDANALQTFVTLLEETPKADFVFSGSWQVAEDGSRFSRSITKVEAERIRADSDLLFCGNVIGAPSATLFRNRNLFFDPNLTWLVDSDFYMGYLHQYPEFCYTTKPLVSIGVSNTQLTESCIQNSEINEKEYGYLFQKYGLQGKKECSRHLVKVFVDYEIAYSRIRKYGVLFREFLPCWMRKKGRYLGSLFLWLPRKIARL